MARAGGMPSPLEALYEETTLQASAALAFPVPAKYIARISSALSRPTQQRLRQRLPTQHSNRFRYARNARSEAEVPEPNAMKHNESDGTELKCVRLVLVRHGESVWNRDQRFTGWADVDLTDDGIAQMHHAAQALRDAAVEFDIAFSSVLTRCIRSQWALLEALHCMWIPQALDWRLNERHYGGLTGRSKEEAVRIFGASAVQRWRRDYDTVPPPLDEVAASHILLDRRYAHLAPHELPTAESLRQTVLRVGAAWRQGIAPALLSGQRVLITGHGNALRALIQLIEGLPDDAVSHIEVANGTPLVYDLDQALSLVRKRELTVPEWPRSHIL